MTLGAAIVAAGFVALLGLLGLVPLGATAVLGTALAVIGAGLVVGAFLHRGRGLIIAAVPLALVLVAAANGAGDGPWNDGDFRVDSDGAPGSVQTLGDASWAPMIGMVAPAYETAFGDAELDLRGLAATPPGSPPVQHRGEQRRRRRHRPRARSTPTSPRPARAAAARRSASAGSTAR